MEIAGEIDVCVSGACCVKLRGKEMFVLAVHKKLQVQMIDSCIIGAYSYINIILMRIIRGVKSTYVLSAH